MATDRDNASLWRKFNKSELDEMLQSSLTALPTEREYMQSPAPTRYNLDTVEVGGVYEVESPHDIWVFTVTEILPRCVVIQYEFNGGKRTMTLDKNEYCNLILVKI